MHVEDLFGELDSEVGQVSRANNCDGRSLGDVFESIESDYSVSEERTSLGEGNADGQKDYLTDIDLQVCGETSG